MIIILLGGINGFPYNGSLSLVRVASMWEGMCRNDRNDAYLKRNLKGNPKNHKHRYIQSSKSGPIKSTKLHYIINK